MELDFSRDVLNFKEEKMSNEKDKEKGREREIGHGFVLSPSSRLPCRLLLNSDPKR